MATNRCTGGGARSGFVQRELTVCSGRVVDLDGVDGAVANAQAVPSEQLA